MHRRFSVSLMLLGLAGLPASALTPGPVFGPETYVRTTGQTNYFQEQFPAVPGGYTMLVINGDDEDSRVSSGTITVNGVSIVTQSDLNQNVEKVVKPVALAADNTMDITIGGQPGSFITVVIGGAAHCHATAGRLLLPWGTTSGGPGTGQDLRLAIKNASPLGARKVRIVYFNPDGTLNAASASFVLAPHASTEVDVETDPAATNWASGSIEIIWGGPKAGRVVGYASVEDSASGTSQMAPLEFGGLHHHHP